MIFFYKGKS